MPTGRAVAEAAAASLAQVTLELGGNDAAVLLHDVEVDRIADRLFWAAFRNCGQVCMAVKRVYAPVRLHAEVVEALAQRAKTVAVGAGLDPDTRLGPVNNAPSWPGSNRSRSRPWRTAPGRRPAATGWTGRATSSLPRSSPMSRLAARW